MTVKARSSRSLVQTSDDNLNVGLTKHESTLTSFMIAGKTVRSVDVITALQSRKNTGTAAASAKATWQASVAADRSELAQTRALVSGVKQSLQVMFAGSADALADFGLTPRKPRVVSPAAKVVAAAKAKATRAARHTQGPKQKGGIKGVLDGVNLVVTAQPAAPSASPAVLAPPTAPAAGGVAATPAPSSK
jgi:hypothetical protein